jgi:hypothetical protein
VQRALSSNPNTNQKHNDEQSPSFKMFSPQNENEINRHQSRRMKYFTASASTLYASSGIGTESQQSTESNGGFYLNAPPPQIKYTSQKRTSALETTLTSTTLTSSPLIIKPLYVNKTLAPMKTLSQELAEELEVTKALLVEHNVPMPFNRTIVKLVRDYICRYGSVYAFRVAYEQSLEERNKLSAFISSTCLNVLSLSQLSSSNNNSVSNNVTPGSIRSSSNGEIFIFIRGF